MNDKFNEIVFYVNKLYIRTVVGLLQATISSWLDRARERERKKMQQQPTKLENSIRRVQISPFFTFHCTISIKRSIYTNTCMHRYKCRHVAVPFGRNLSDHRLTAFELFFFWISSFFFSLLCCGVAIVERQKLNLILAVNGAMSLSSFPLVTSNRLVAIYLSILK